MPKTQLPCPLCGRDAGCEEVDDNLFQVLCHGTDGIGPCGYSGHYGEDETSAIAAHNAVSSAVADRDRLTLHAAQLREALAEMRDLLQMHIDVYQVPVEEDDQELIDTADAALAATAPAGQQEERNA